MHYTITGGEEMSAYFSIHRTDCPDSVPFNEQMDLGSPKEDLFSGMFIVERLSALHTNISNYQDKVLKYLYALREPEKNTYHLYFPESPRSYANILTVLAYLDHYNYREKVKVTFTSPDYSDDLLTLSVSASGMYQQYKQYCHSKDPEALRSLLIKEKETPKNAAPISADSE